MYNLLCTVAHTFSSILFYMYYVDDDITVIWFMIMKNFTEYWQ